MNQDVAEIELERFFHSQMEGANERTAVAYRKALASVGRFLSSHNISVSDLDEQSLRKWICSLFVEGRTVSTVSYYFDNFAALYGKAVKQRKAMPLGAFATLKAELREISGQKFTDCRGALGKILHVAESRKDGELGRLTDFFLCQLFQGGVPFQSVARLKKDNLQELTEAARTIAARQQSAKRRYIFALSQAASSDRRLSSYLTSKLPFVVQYWGLNPSVDVEDTALNYWIQSALECGIDSGKVAGTVRKIPADCLSLKFVTPADVSPEEAHDIVDTVASTLAANPLQWFAMRLRSKVRKQDIEDRISASESLRGRVCDLFYPCEEITHRIDRRLVREVQPVIPDVMFFRAHVTDVLPLFREIGDLAWCYRGNSGSDSTYSVIPDGQMREFQRCIGQFSPDLCPQVASECDYERGQMVRITSGPRAGFVGEIVKIGSRAKMARFTLRLLGMDFLNWYEDLQDWEFELLKPEEAERFLSQV